MWKDEFEPKELENGPGWRTDRVYLGTDNDGNVVKMKKNSHSQWWNQRHGIWTYIQAWIDRGETELAAIERAECVFDNARGSDDRTKRPGIKSISAAFKSALFNDLQIVLRGGRPRKKDSYVWLLIAFCF